MQKVLINDADNPVLIHDFLLQQFLCVFGQIILLLYLLCLPNLYAIIITKIGELR